MYLLGTASAASGFAFLGPIPKGARLLYVESSSTGIGFLMGSATGATFAPATGSTGVGAAMMPFGLSAGFRVPRIDANVIVAVYNTNGGPVSATIYGAPAS